MGTPFYFPFNLIYEEFNTSQLVLPMDIEILIPKNHFCRLIYLVIEMTPALFANL